ncbi:MAG: hypothetical protein HYS12_18525 [Planctomycetes bacterium]|nr:hypothetical protein [Planctomycetota bacterium]
MSFARGLILIASFSLTWGLLSGINAAILLGVVGAPRGFFSLAVSVVLGLMETLMLLALVDRYFFKALRQLKRELKEIDKERKESSVQEDRVR